MPGTLLSLTVTQRDPTPSEITIWDLPEAPGSPGTSTSWRRLYGWGAVPSPDGTHLCCYRKSHDTHTSHRAPSQLRLGPVLLQLGLSSPAQADTHAPVYRLQNHFCSTGRWTGCSLLPAVGQGSAHCRPGCRPKSCCHQTDHLTVLD
jgi:hypothetical protein